MSTMYRFLRAEKGVAMMAVIMAIFILTIVVAALAIATMGESSLSFDQLRGQQALSVAEAGAFRALADLRRRLSTDLNSQIQSASSLNPSGTETNVRNICQQAGGPPARSLVEILTNYAWPAALGSSDWARTGDTATISIGTAGSRIQMTDRGTGALIGDFYATAMVRPSGAPATCLFGASTPEQDIMWFDFAILAVGRSASGTAQRTVCLRSSLADRCPDWFPAPSVGWQGSYTITGGTSSGWPVLIEKAAYSQWALMLLNVGSVWLFTGTNVNGPIHSNTNIRIAGNPSLNQAVTQVLPDMTMFNCGSQVNIAVPPSNPNATLQTPGCDNTSGNVFGSTVTAGVASIPLPSNANPSRTSTGLTPTGANATNQEVRDRTTALPDGPGPVPDGLYVMDQCGSPACGGIYIRGDVQQMVLSSENNDQVIRITTQTNPDPLKQNMKIIVDPTTKALTLCWNFIGPDPGVGDCSGWGNSQVYAGATFNGVVYVSGSITSDPDPAASSGLYGIVNRAMPLTIATENDLRITNQLVYEAPPAGPNHNPLNVLGLYSVTSNVTIVGALTPNDLYVDAVVLAPTGKFWVEGWNTLAPKGNVYSLGGTVQGTFGAFGGFSPTTGYGRVMTYDWRLASNVSPPFFPLTDIYTAPRWQTPNPVFTNGDPLYNRPEWEEMVGL
ncbi:MAG: hypothetical protein ACT4P5_03150 [Armatimonadota bacterium]